MHFGTMGFRLLNWPGSRVQALAAADARALDVAKVLEIPRQLKYARKAKHCSPNAAFSIQVCHPRTDDLFVSLEIDS